MTLERRNGTERALFLWVGFSFQKNDLLGCKTVFARVASRLNFHVSRTGPHFILSLWPILYVFLGKSRDKSWIILCFQGGRKVLYSNYMGLRVCPPRPRPVGRGGSDALQASARILLGRWCSLAKTGRLPAECGCEGKVLAGPGWSGGTAWGPLPRSLFCVSCIACGQ